MSRVRQAVFAARDLEGALERLRSELRLGEPFRDEAVGYFGLRNGVFAIGDTFLEVVSPDQPGTAAGRLLERRGGDCGYMVMLQVDDVAAARTRAAGLGVREVFQVELDDIAEAHLHPADMRGAIVSVSRPEPAEAWRWGGPDWAERSVPGRIAGVTIAVADPKAAEERWTGVAGALPGVEFVRDESEPGLVAVHVERDGERLTARP